MFNEHDHDDFRIECVDTLNYVFESLLGYKTIKMATKMGVKTIF